MPRATLASAGGPVEVEITFGHAQHGKYTIQVFDPTGTRELAAERGVSTDTLPDRFALALSAADLSEHLLQWSGAVDAFSNRPGQQFLVTFDVRQGGQRVNGGHIQKSGPLNVTQAFLGGLVLVTS